MKRLALAGANLICFGAIFMWMRSGAEGAFIVFLGVALLGGSAVIESVTNHEARRDVAALEKKEAEMSARIESLERQVEHLNKSRALGGM